MTFIDLFAGIGGFRLAFEQAGHTCVFSSEIDKFARTTYAANFCQMPAGDIRQIDAADIPPHDIITAGIPCQSFSVAGKRKGLHDLRGTLFYEVVRIAEHHAPRIILIENVKGLVNHDKGATLKMILWQFKALGYVCDYRVLNAKQFGLPQNRERVFIIARNDGQPITWPTPPNTPTRLGSILHEEVDQKYYYSEKQLRYHLERKEKHRAKGNGFGCTIVYPDSLVTPTLTAHYCKDGSEIILSDVRSGSTTVHSWDMIPTDLEERVACKMLMRLRRRGVDGHPVPRNHFAGLEHAITSLIEKGIIYQVGNSIEFVHSKQNAGINGVYRLYSPSSSSFSTITAHSGNDYLLTHAGLRKLTPRECARLQGYPDSFVFPVSDSQAYKQLGNSVAIPVVTALAQVL